MGRSLTMHRFRLSAGVAVVDAALANLTEDESRRQHLDAKFGAWRDDPPKQPIDWDLLDPVAAVSEGNATMRELDDRSILVTGDRPEVDTYEIVYETDAKRVTGFRLEALPDARLPNYGPGRGSFNGDGAFVITEFRVMLDSSEQEPAAPAAGPSRSQLGLGLSAPTLTKATGEGSEDDEDPPRPHCFRPCLRELPERKACDRQCD